MLADTELELYELNFTRATYTAFQLPLEEEEEEDFTSFPATPG